MRAFRFLILLIILPLFIIACSKKDNGDFNPDLTNNIFYINDNNNDYVLTDGFVAYYGEEHSFENFNYSIVLYSSGISFDTSYSFDEEFQGTGDAIGIDIIADAWDGPDPGTYSTDFEEGEQGIEDIVCYINFNIETEELSHLYYFSSATIILQKEGSEYELTINGSGVEYNDNDEIINDGIKIAAHYKGSLPEYYFLTEDPSKCSFNADTIDFTYGIDYDHPEKYLVPGEQSDLSANNLEIIRNAIGTPITDIVGILDVCHCINQNFTFEDAGGAMAGVNTVDELFNARTFYGCHSLALIISSVLREFGIPAVMIETADVKWGFEYRAGDVDYFSGHVMSEVYINNKWILLDNNCTYVDDYDYTNPYISVMSPNQGDLFVFAKGVDIWDYRGDDDSFTQDKLLDFSYNIHCYEYLFYTAHYVWYD